jgi:hypothetical protein
MPGFCEPGVNDHNSMSDRVKFVENDRVVLNARALRLLRHRFPGRGSIAIVLRRPVFPAAAQLRLLSRVACNDSTLTY